jgi:lipopolysaccharide transport system permease protein
VTGDVAESAYSQGLGQYPRSHRGDQDEVGVAMTDLVLRTARPASIQSLLSPANLVANLMRHKDLTRQFAVRFFLARYRGTYLGAAWALVFPLILLGVYTFIFNFVFASRVNHQIPGIGGVLQPETSSQYAVWLFLGMTVFGVFSESVIRSCGLVLENPNYVTKVVFPLEIMPLASLASALMFSCFGFSLVLIGLVVFYPTLHWTIVLLPVVLIPLLALALGLSWFLASLAVFVRDISNLVVIVVGQLLFFMTPIFYRAEDLKQWAWLARVNPIAVVVESARDVTLYGRMPDWASLGLVTLLGLIITQLGYAWFIKSKRGFADVL